MEVSRHLFFNNVWEDTAEISPWLSPYFLKQNVNKNVDYIDA